MNAYAYYSHLRYCSIALHTFHINLFCRKSNVITSPGNNLASSADYTLNETLCVSIYQAVVYLL